MKPGRALSFLQPLPWLALWAGLGLGTARAQEDAEIAQLLQAGRLSEAQTRVERQLASKPRDPQLRLYKGVIQRESGRAAEALQTFTRLSEDHPELPEPHNNLAVIYAAQGQYDKARIALEKALRTHPSYATAHDNLADVYARLAGQAYSKALQLEGTAPPSAGMRLALIRELALAPAGSVTRPHTAAPVLAAAPAAPAPIVAPTPAPSKPAVAAPVAAPAPAPATPTTLPAVTASAPVAPATPATAVIPAVRPESQREVEQAVRAWARAWADKNMTQYLAAYHPAFETPGRQSRSAWEQDRHLRITGKNRITLELLDLQITVQGTRAVAKFRQDYKADTLAVLSRKTLELSKSGERWLIVKEASGG